jgi:amidase
MMELTGPMDNIHYLSLLELTQMMHAGELSPVEVTEAQLQRIEALDGNLKSFALVTPELALAQAKPEGSLLDKGYTDGRRHDDLCGFQAG